MGLVLLVYPYDTVYLTGLYFRRKWWLNARGGDILDIRKFIVSSQAPPRPCSPSTVCTAFDIVRPFSRGFMAINIENIAK